MALMKKRRVNIYRIREGCVLKAILRMVAYGLLIVFQWDTVQVKSCYPHDIRLLSARIR